MPARPNPEMKYKSKNARYIASNGYTNNPTRTFISSTRNWSGVKTPNFSNPKLRPKPLPLNPYSVKFTERMENLINRYRWRNNNPGNEWDDWDDTPINMAYLLFKDRDHSYDLWHDWKAYNLALAAAQSATKDMKVNLAQAFAERKQTVATITDAVQRITKAFTAVKKGRMRDAAKALGAFKRKQPPKPTRNIANDWLALQYGWLPLLSDVKGSAELLAQHLATDQRKEVIKVSKRRTSSDCGSHNRSYNGTEGVVSWQEQSQQTTARVYLEFSVSSPSLATLNQTGISDPLLLSWELLPYSFVVDWFLPIGNFLECLNYDLGLSFKRGYWWVKSENTWVATFNGKQVNDGTYTSKYSTVDCITSKNVMFDRGVYASAPNVKLPSLSDSPLNVTRALNALSLMSQVFGRR